MSNWNQYLISKCLVLTSEDHESVCEVLIAKAGVPVIKRIVQQLTFQVYKSVTNMSTSSILIETIRLHS